MTRPRPTVPATYGAVPQAGHEPGNLADILERVLDRGLVIAGDIRVNLLDIELLTIKLRLVIASVDTAREIGIDWWEHDPWLTSHPRRRLGAGPGPRDAVESGRRPRRRRAEQEAARDDEAEWEED
jgi:hypothetical protein